MSINDAHEIASAIAERYAYQAHPFPTAVEVIHEIYAAFQADVRYSHDDDHFVVTIDAIGMKPVVEVRKFETHAAAHEWMRIA